MHVYYTKKQTKINPFDTNLVINLYAIIEKYLIRFY